KHRYRWPGSSHHHTRWCPLSNDVTGNVSSNLSEVWVSPGILAHSECQSPEPCSTHYHNSHGHDFNSTCNYNSHPNDFIWIHKYSHLNPAHSL
ncbi:hypothetical protein A6R68_17864, partial [Neotoma lepida]